MPVIRSCRGPARVAVIFLLIACALTSAAQNPNRKSSAAPQQERGLGIKPAPTPTSSQSQTSKSVASRPELVLQAGHTAQVDSIVFSPNGRWFATASSDKTVKIWDPTTGAELRTLVACTAVLLISPDSRWLAAWGEDKVKVWNVITGRQIQSFAAPRLREVALSPLRSLPARRCANHPQPWLSRNDEGPPKRALRHLALVPGLRRANQTTPRRCRAPRRLSSPSTLR